MELNIFWLNRVVIKVIIYILGDVSQMQNIKIQKNGLGKQPEM